MTQEVHSDEARENDRGTPAVISADHFLETVLRSQILDEASLNQALAEGPEDIRDDAEGLAAHLVRIGKLTRFQARKLLQGVALGLVLGKYQVLAPIGRGGMGTVFLARDGRNGPLIALKVLPPRKARKKQRSLARFLREMTLSKHVRHPHLAWTHEAGRIQGVYYIAMEFIPGKNLSKLVAADGPLSVSRAARLVAEAAEGLHYAHDQGVIHRDLKPSNIMVTPNDHAKVLDLGLAIVEGEIVTDHRVVGGQGVIVGTMDYIAPEQTRNAVGVDRRADIYSLGCTLFFALTGRPPFPGGDSKEKVRCHRFEDPPELRRLRDDLPKEFATLVKRMMAKDPDQRFANAQEVVSALRPWIGAETVLPLDNPEDAVFQAAVSELAEADQLPSGSISEIPSVENTGDAWNNESKTINWAFWLALGIALGLLFLAGAALALIQRLGWLR